MVQDPQPVQQTVTRVAQRATPSIPSSESRTVAATTESERTVGSAEKPARPDEPRTDALVTTVPETGRTAEVSRTGELRADLVRAQTALQIAREAIAAIGTAYGGMQALAEQGADEGLTAEDRASLVAAFQRLKQSIDDIVETTVFNGDRILKGGDGPEGAYVINLFTAGGSSGPLDILIPAGWPTLDPERPEDGVLLPGDVAETAWKSPETAAQFFRRIGNTIESQRAALQQLYAAATDPAEHPGDQTDPVEPLENAQKISRSVSEVVLAGGAVPFQNAADGMRVVLNRAHNDTQPAVRGAAAPRAWQRVTGDPVPRAEVLPSTAPVSEANAGVPASSPDKAPNPAAPAPGGGTDSGKDFQALAEIPDRAAPTVGAQDTNPPPRDGDAADSQGVSATEAGNQDNGHEDGAPLPPAAGRSPVPDGTAVPAGTAVAVSESAATALDNAPPGSGEIVPPHGASDDRQTPVFQPVSASPTGNAPAAQITGPRSATAAAQPAEPPATNQSDTDVSDDASGEPLLVATQEHIQLRNQPGLELRQTELTRPAELNAGHRPSGAVQQSRDSDLRLDAGLIAPRAASEEPADPVHGFGPPLSVDPGGFMAELVRADTMLHIADLSIEQIDLQLDYARDLAEEATTDTSGDRLALDDIFQAVKSDVIDALARTTEAQGEKILAGGDGPGGDFVILLSGGAAPGEAPDIAIPSMRLGDLSADLPTANIRTADAAIAALDHIEFAGDDAIQARETIAEQRALVRQLMSLEIARNGPRRSIA